MAIYRLKSKLFYTPAEKASYAAGKKADMQNKNKALTGQVTDLQNKPNGIGTGLAIGTLGTLGGTAALNTMKRNSEENADSMSHSETY